MLLRGSMGFSLIELVIVVLIIAIIVGIAIPVYIMTINSASKRTCQSNLRTIDGAINTYFTGAFKYPDNIGQMASGCYRVLKDADFCPTNNSPYTLLIVAGSRPTVSCPDGITGHEI